MAERRQIYGVDQNADLDPALLHRETRPFRYRLRDFIYEDTGITLMALGMLIAFLPFTDLPQVSDLLFAFALLFAWFAASRQRQYRFRAPMARDKDGKVVNDGILFIGNERENGVGIWLSKDNLCAHTLVFGTTGSGKTRFLLGVLYQAILMGSGCMYVDGKADNTVFWLVYSLVRRLNRLDDFLVINYLTGGDTTQQPQGADKLLRKTNTTNPFAYGNGEQLRSLIVGLMRGDKGGGDMWKGRASAFVAALMKCLTYLRDRGDINLDIELIRSYMPLERVCELALRNDIPEAGVGSIRKYLAELPAYNDDDARSGQLNAKTNEQHGYIIMQLTEVMNDLSETYGHIFGAELGEIDFKDVVFNRRILFVMLPSLEKDPDALAGLGKLVVAGVRSALAPALGDKVEGSKGEVIDRKPTNSKYPFFLILDEYGYYAVEGFAVVAAQARSLGVAVIFAGQDYPSFKRADEKEAASTVANTSNKMVMKLEDADETYRLIEARGGSAAVATTSGHEQNTGIMGGYNDQKTTRIEERKRINLRDLVRQGPGEAHVMFGDTLARCQLFYADPTQVSEAQLNKFLMVRNPSRAKLDSIHGTFHNLNTRWGIKSTAPAPIAKPAPRHTMRGRDQARNTEPQENQDQGLKQLIADLKRVNALFPSATNRNGIYALALTEIRQLPPEDTTPEAAPETPTEPAAEFAADPVSETTRQETTLPFLEDAFPHDDGDLPVFDYQGAASEAENLARDLLTQMVENAFESRVARPLTAAESAQISPMNQLRDIEMQFGASDDQAATQAEAGMKMIEAALEYPTKPILQKLPQDKVQLLLDELQDKANKLGDLR